MLTTSDEEPEQRPQRHRHPHQHQHSDNNDEDDTETGISSSDELHRRSHRSGDQQPLIVGQRTRRSSPSLAATPANSEGGRFPGTRHILGLMGFLGFANVYAMRVNLSVAVVAMVNHTAFPIDNSTVLNVCPMPAIDNSTVPNVSVAHHRKFDYDLTILIC